jgi:glycosyltransferase involved in cell wall biosynthesis
MAASQESLFPRVKPRLAVVASTPVPYRPPIWRCLQDIEGLDFQVLYASLAGAEPYQEPLFGRTIQWDRSVLSGYSWKQVKRKSFERINWRLKYIVPDMEKHLKTGCFTHVMLPGKEHVYYYQALWAARRLGLPVLYRADSHPAKTGWVADRIARMTRASLYRKVSAFLCHGYGQFTEYEAYGIPRGKMFFSPYCVDNGFFESQRSQLSGQRHSIRANYGVAPGDFLVGYTGKLYPWKNPLELIEAVGRLRREELPVKLLMVGDGPQRAECERVANQVMPGAAVFTGFLNQSELARAYVAMDMFVMPSVAETWGLVLNEAMVFGLPVMATATSQAAAELIQEGTNGLLYMSGDVSALCAGIRKIRDQVSRGMAMGEQSRLAVAKFSPERAAQGIMEAIRATGGVG